MKLRLLPSAYIRLMRLHQPVGVWLLLWPCFWSLALSGAEASLYGWFFLGALFMRSAGCIINDMADRRFDREVARTRTRPLASGEVSVREALLLLALLIALSLLIALQLRQEVLAWAAAALPLVIAYPFMKRITYWPQGFLGLTFNWGALLGSVAVEGAPSFASWLLYAGCFFWTLGYDTIYAHQDRADDARIGVKSTALRLGDASKAWIMLFYGMSLGLWLAAGLILYTSAWYYFFLTLMGAGLIMQPMRFDPGNPLSCKRYFMLNARLGAVLWAGCLLARMPL